MKYWILAILALSIVGCESKDNKVNARPKELPSMASAHELNREYLEERRRLRELDEAVKNLAPGSDAAMRDASRIRSDPASAGARRELVQNQLDDAYEACKQQIQLMQERSAARDESQKTSNNGDPYLGAKISDQRALVEIKKQLDYIANLRATFLNCETGYAPENNNTPPVRKFEIEE